MSLFGILELENRKFNILQFISVCELYAVVGTGLAAQTSHRSQLSKACDPALRVTTQLIPSKILPARPVILPLSFLSTVTGIRWGPPGSGPSGQPGPWKGAHGG